VEWLLGAQVIVQEPLSNNGDMPEYHPSFFVERHIIRQILTLLEKQDVFLGGDVVQKK
jgi:hypothetical protein